MTHDILIRSLPRSAPVWVDTDTPQDFGRIEPTAAPFVSDQRCALRVTVNRFDITALNNSVISDGILLDGFDPIVPIGTAHDPADDHRCRRAGAGRESACGLAMTVHARRRRVRFIGALASLLAPLALAQQPPLRIGVDTFADLIDDNTGDGVCHTSANTCSLRAAVMQANHLTIAGTIQIDVPAGTYRLTRVPSAGADEASGDLDLLSPLAFPQTIVVKGAGATRTIIDANTFDRAVEIRPNRSAAFSGLTIRNGRQDDGAGILVAGGTLAISDCVIEENQASDDGGGIYLGSGSLSMDRCTVRSNVATSNGGGLYLSAATTIRNSTLHGNTADNGAGIYSNVQLVLLSSTLTGNFALSDGGGIYSDSPAFLYSTSIISNIADVDHDIHGGMGGGLYAEPGARFVVINSLVVGNAINAGYDDNDCSGSFELYGYNLFGEAVDCTTSGNAGALGFTDLSRIGPLQENQGPTPTHALLAGSDAINASTAQGCIDENGLVLATDQRGAARISGPRCDIGAFEYGSVIDRIFRNGFD